MWRAPSTSADATRRSAVAPDLVRSSSTSSAKTHASSRKPTSCPDCGVPPGTLHQRYCDVERCRSCGSQYGSCGCRGDRRRRLPWTGLWPGEAECREFGWFISAVGNQPCGPDDPGAMPDIGRFFEEARWDRRLGRFVRSEATAGCA